MSREFRIQNSEGRIAKILATEGAEVTEGRNSKHQILNKSELPNTNDQKKQKGLSMIEIAAVASLLRNDRAAGECDCASRYCRSREPPLAERVGRLWRR